MLSDSLVAVIELIFKVFTNPFGIFLTSFIANSIPFVAIPYLLLVLMYSLAFQDLIPKLIIALSSAIGAALGKVVIYSIGGSVRLGLSDKTIRNLELFNKVAGKSLFIAVFLFASLPLPDDVLYIPLGISKYNFIRYFIAVLAGKIAMTVTVVIYGHMFISIVGESTFLLPIYLALTAFLSYTIIRVDWSVILEALNDRGLKEAISEFLKQLTNIYKLKIPRTKTATN